MSMSEGNGELTSIDQFITELLDSSRTTTQSNYQIEQKLKKVYAEILRDSGTRRTDKVVTWKELYHFFTKKLESAVSTKWINKLLKVLDKNNDGSVSEEEFVQSLIQHASSLRKKQRLEEEVASMPVPNLHVVPGSTRLNVLSNTKCFRTQVIARSELRLFASVWKELDADQDGQVDMQDFKWYLSRVLPHLRPMGASLFNAIDRARRGSVSFKQLLKALYPEASERDLLIMMGMANYTASDGTTARADEAMLAEVESIFRVYDDNQSGGLDEEEFASAMQLAGFSEEEATDLFQKVDVDGSGMVSFEEFRDWYVSYYRQVGKSGNVMSLARELAA